MIKGPAYQVKLIIKGPWADISLPARLNTYEGALLHSLSGGEGGRLIWREGGKQTCFRVGEEAEEVAPV